MDDDGDVEEAEKRARFLVADPSEDSSDSGESTDRATTTARMVIGAIALVVVGVLIGRLTAPDGDPAIATDVTENPTSESTTPVTFPAGDQSREPWWGLVGYKRVAVDTFDRPDTRTGLGETGTGQTWETKSGRWGIEGKVARQFASDPTHPSFAIVPAAKGDGLVEVTMAAAEQDAGLVFRYQDAANYWAVTTNPSLGSWKVTRTVDGKQEAVGELTASVKAGTTITVVMTGPQIRFLVDSVEALSVDDSTFAGVRSAGLIAPAGSPLAARWDRFLTMEQPKKK